MSPSMFLRAAVALPLASAAVVDLPIIIRNSYASVQLSAGTPPVTHHLRFDTGSASTWIVDSVCAASCGNHPDYPRTPYNPDASSTANTTGPFSTIEYLSDHVSGVATRDVFSIQNDGVPPLEWNQTFLAASEATFRWVTADGFLGMAFSTIAQPGTTTVFETMMQQRLVDAPRFGIYSGGAAETGDTPTGGQMTLGGSREDEYVDGDLTWVPLREEYYQVWRTSLHAFRGARTVDGKTETVDTGFGSVSAFAVFDTGAGSILVPEAQAEALYASIGMNYTAILEGDHIPLCSEFDDSWSVSFMVGNDAADPIPVTLTGSQLRRPGFADGSPEYCFPPFDSNPADGFVLIGTPLLRQIYSVWDFGAFDAANYKPRIGFGKLKEQYKPKAL